MLLYLASPYSVMIQSLAPHVAEALKRQRFERVCKVAARLMLEGHQVFCPIAHSHPIEVYGMPKIMSGEFWALQDNAILKHCDEVWVLQLDGWERSKGIKVEIALADELGIPVKFIMEDAFGSIPAIYSPEPLCSLERSGTSAGNVAGDSNTVL